MAVEVNRVPFTHVQDGDIGSSPSTLRWAPQNMNIDGNNISLTALTSKNARLLAALQSIVFLYLRA